MKRGGLAARVIRLEGTGALECQTCHGRAGHGGIYMERADGVCRDHHGRALPDGPDIWTCAVCGRTYQRPRVVIRVVGRRTGADTGEGVKAGLARVTAQGKRLRRPEREVSEEQIASVRGLPVREAALCVCVRRSVGP